MEDMEARLYRLAAAATLMDLAGKSAFESGDIAQRMDRDTQRAIARAGRLPVRWQAKQRVLGLLWEWETKHGKADVAGPADDHPGRKGGQVPRRGSGHKRRRYGKSASPLRALKRIRA